jgi:quercetin dioxygenase-like cupin family protein
MQNNLAEKETLPEKTSHEKLIELQNLMLEHRCDMPECEHIFTPGVYTRRFEMPAGMVVIGRTHKHEHLIIILSGHAEIVSGDDRYQVKGGDSFVSPAGTKRAVLAFNDTVFLTVHPNPTDSRNIEELESEIIEEDDFKPEYHKAVVKNLRSTECLSDM